jgi:ATP-binding cassette subfamily B protein
MRYFSSLVTGKDQAKEVRLFGLGDFFIQRYLDIFERFHERYRRLRIKECWLETTLAALGAAGSWLAYVYIALAALARRITLGSLSFYVGAFYQVQSSVAGIVNDLATLYGDNLFVTQVFEFLDTPPAIEVPPSGRALPAPRPLRQGITFDHVGFQYPGTERHVLEDVSFSIAPGQCVALVGENGAGKTTLIKLLTRLYDPTQGRVLVDGVDLREYDLTSWRQQIAVIFQDFVRYHLPARTNIGLGQVERLHDVAAVQAAAARGGAVPVVERLPDGYDTILGRQFWTAQSNFGTVRVQEGSELSGGEWQKIALSRAFMRSGEDGVSGDAGDAGDAGGGAAGGTGAQLLILDEPTAALDVQAEYDVYLRFSELTQGKATLLISHRFSTVKMADAIVVLEHGGIVEQGSHDELVRLGGRYAELYEKQASRYR